VKKSKCSFAQNLLAYLGYIIGEHGVSTDAKKLAPILKWPTPSY
jgi:hypothetical protein